MRIVALALCLGLTLFATPARADEPAGTALVPVPVPAPDNAPAAPLTWKWSRFSAANYAVTLTGGAVTLAMAIVKPVPQHKLMGGILFDEAARDAIRPDDITTRYAFRDASDVGVSLLVTWPFFADALTTAWWFRGSRDAAEQMALIDLETLAVAGAVQGITNVVVSRERPYGRDCDTPELPGAALDCANSSRFRSFFSGHSAFSFTSAALICVHHFKNDLLGAPWDAVSCAGGYGVAAATAFFRMTGDVHYASDVLTGAAIGTLIGYGVPLLHYANETGAGARVGDLKLQLVPVGAGLGVAGSF
ncbi:MAG TPA: phosphatase PAP2 family protein [Polyangiaceae bacterium]